MPPLASPSDLADRLGRSLTAEETARAEALLADASALVRSYAGRTFEHVDGDVQTLRVIGGRITLPSTPVTAVTGVRAMSGRDDLPDITLADWVWDGIDSIRIGEGTYVINLPEVWWDDDGYPGTYRVTYSHGYETVPADVVAVVCGMVLRVFGNPSNLRSETVGSYSVTYSIPVTGEALGINLSRYEREVLDRYRRSATTVKVTR